MQSEIEIKRERIVQTGRLMTRLRGVTMLPPSILFSCLWLMAMVFVAIFAGWIEPYDYSAMDVMHRLQAPFLFGGSADHLLGTDQLGRDIFSRLIESIQISISISVMATMISTVIGVTLGFAAAHFRGIVDHIVQTMVDAQLAMPFMIIAMAMLAFVGNSLVFFVVLLGISGWESVTRISRGLALSANAQGYASAARELGYPSSRIYLRHILPNISATIVIAMTLNIPGVILLESSLSFLGIGIQPPYTSLGNMVGYGRDYIQSAPWIMLLPSGIIVITTLAVSMLGDWLRDHLDPTVSR